MTLLDIEVSHDKALAETSWKPLTDFTLSEKFTRKDKIKHTRSPFSAWTTATP